MNLYNDRQKDVAPVSVADLLEAQDVARRILIGMGCDPDKEEKPERTSDKTFITPDGMTLDQVAAQLGVSRERVRQIQAKAFEKVRNRVNGNCDKLFDDFVETIASRKNL